MKSDQEKEKELKIATFAAGCSLGYGVTIQAATLAGRESLGTAG